MRFPPSFLEEIKARLPVSEVVRRRVKLTKAGREWKGLSPFNSEKTPSFTVNDQKGFYHCFSSSNHGNIFDFVMATEGLSFPEAVERLASDAGLPMPVVTRESQEQEEKRAGLHELIEAACVFFEKQLHERIGQKARAYIETRGLTRDTQRQFRIGYSPGEKYALRDHLAGKGFAVEAMAEAGLLIHGEDIAVPYDRFRDRLMFPICDRSGRVIAFGGRTLDKDGQPKYLNSPETPLFHKGAILYNHHQARKAAHDAGRVIVVEGYVDVISMAQAGIGFCVAPLGTALTPDQCQLLWKMGEEPILCFDGDKAGRKAAFRAFDMALPLIGEGRSLRFALLPEGQDPDDLARSGGKSTVEAAIGDGLPLVDMMWMRETEGVSFDTPERRAALHRRLSELTRQIPDETLKHYYRAEIKTRLDTLFGTGRPPRETGRWFENGGGFRRSGFAPNRFGGGSMSSGAMTKSPPAISSSLAASSLFKPSAALLSPRETLILLLVVNHPGLIDTFFEDLASLDFDSPEAGRLAETLLELAEGPLPDDVTLKVVLRDRGFGALVERLERNGSVGSHWYCDPSASETDAGEVLKQALTLHRRTRALHRELQLAELALGNDASELNLARLRDIQDQLSALSGMEAVVEGFGVSSGRFSGSL